MRISRIAFGLLFLSGSPAAAQTAASMPAACAALKQLQVPGVQLGVAKSEWVPAGTTSPPGPGGPPSVMRLPAYCRVDALIDRRVGAAGVMYEIGFALA